MQQANPPLPRAHTLLSGDKTILRRRDVRKTRGTVFRRPGETAETEISLVLERSQGGDEPEECSSLLQPCSQRNAAHLGCCWHCASSRRPYTVCDDPEPRRRAPTRQTDLSLPNLWISPGVCGPVSRSVDGAHRTQGLLRVERRVRAQPTIATRVRSRAAAPSGGGAGKTSPREVPRRTREKE